MSTSNIPNNRQPKRIPRWLAYVLFAIIWGVAPWAVSLLSPRYGSVAVFIAFLVWWAWFSFFQVPQEERTIEARFGEAYREYKSRVPRWFGKPRG